MILQNDGIHFQVYTVSQTMISTIEAMKMTELTLVMTLWCQLISVMREFCLQQRDQTVLHFSKFFLLANLICRIFLSLQFILKRFSVTSFKIYSVSTKSLRGFEKLRRANKLS
jgi:hypothetical protein